MKPKILLTIKLSMLIVLFILTGCASIPAEAPELSKALGQRISALEEANITLLHHFFDQKRQQVDEFIVKEWVPTFAEEFFSNPKIAEAWNTIVRENNKHQRLQFIVKVGPKLQAKINEKRIELIRPLDDLERRIESNIRGNYQQARSINNSITSFLISASKVAENRQRYLEKIGVTDEKLTKAITNTDEVVSDLLHKTKDATEKVNAAKEYIDKLHEIRESL